MSSFNSYNDSEKAQYDAGIILVYMLLCVAGILTIYSSAFSKDSSWLDFSESHAKQALFFGISFFMGIIILYTDTKVFFHLAYVFFGIVLVFTAGTFVLGSEINGAKAWYKIGTFQMQPAEFAKIGAVLALARFLGTYGIKLDNFKNYALASIFVIVPMGLVLAQNDTGSALVFFSLVLVFYRFGLPGWILGIGVSFIIVFSVLMVMGDSKYLGLKPKWFLSVLLLLLFSALIYFNRYNKLLIKVLSFLLIIYIGFIHLAQFGFDQLKDYQRRRIELIFGLIEDKRGTGYNLFQSKVAIGGGQFTGKGYLQGTQAQLNFVPEPSTDFIFCTLAEETGFIGSATFVLLYLYFLYRIAIMAERQNTKFSMAYGYGVFSIFFFHFTINLSMTMGLAPTIGIPLPFISYGGSSLLAFTILLFIFIRLDGNRANEVSVDLR